MQLHFDPKQFYSNFAITFQDETKWILYTTTSCRSDRIKGNQWDSHNIKKIDKSVKQSILIYPDSVSEDELDLFQAYNLKIQNKVPYSEIADTKNKMYYSAIDCVVSQGEFFEMIQNYANINLSKTLELKPYLEKLIRWVIGGYGGKTKTSIQCADYILIHDENDIYIHTLDEYVNLLLKPDNAKHFGTPFQWTYASGRKGKDIQLKCIIIK